MEGVRAGRVGCHQLERTHIICGSIRALTQTRSKLSAGRSLCFGPGPPHRFAANTYIYIHGPLQHYPGLGRGKLETCRASFPSADLWRLVWHCLEDLGGLQPQLTISWTPGHGSGTGIKAVGNRWADAIAKKGASVHEVPEAMFETVVALRRKLMSILKWYGRAAALYTRPGMPPSRAAKADWPFRIASERRRLHSDRNGIVPLAHDGTTSIFISKDHVTHTQYVTYSVGALVAARLTALAHERARGEKLEAEHIVNRMAVSPTVEEDPRCQWCGKRRKLAFIHGIRGRQPC